MRPALQTTLKAPTAWIGGVHLDRDAPARVRFHPAGADEGIVFVRSDLPGAPTIRCQPAHLRSMPRWTALEADGAWVHHTEHVLAAIALCGVDNVRVEMDADRLPMMADGTCAAFLSAMQQAGLAPQGVSRQVYALKGPVFFHSRENTQGRESNGTSLKDGRYVMGLPAKRLSVSAVFHWPHAPSLSVGVAEFEAGDAADLHAVAHARSYLVETEVEQVRDLLGPVRDHLMVLRSGGPAELAHEAARHKIVDFLGDMMVLGRPLIGRFAAFRAGHRIHHELVRELVGEGRLQLVEAP